MPTKLYHVIEKKLLGVNGLAVYFEPPDRNCVLETLSLRIVSTTGTYTPVVTYWDDDGGLFAAAVAPGKVLPSSQVGHVCFALGGGEHDGPLVLQGLLPLVTLVTGFSITVVMEGAADPSLLEFDARATFLV